jgi:hypothetical protein
VVAILIHVVLSRRGLNVKKQLQSLKFDQLTAVFLASMFGSLMLSVMLNSAIEPGVPLPLSSRVLLTAAAIIVYASVVWTTFYFLVPKYRPALLRIVQIKSH